MNLTEIGIKYHTDKAYEHEYTSLYEKHFKPIRKLTNKLLEIGIYKGASLKMWAEYFPNAHIYGLDLKYCRIPSERITTYKGRQESRQG